MGNADKRYVAVVNPAAGGGRCGKLAGPALERLQSAGLELDVVHTQGPGEASKVARERYAAGCRRFLAVGGDGTGYEVLNGLFPSAVGRDRPRLAFLPLGTGNSFLRDFSDKGLDYAVESILADRTRSCDVVRVTHGGGELFSINLVSIGFVATAGKLANERYKGLGELGYLLAVLAGWLRLEFPTFPMRVDGSELDRRPCTYLTFNNSRYTGGKLLIAPDANTGDGFIEMARLDPLGRLDFLATFPKIFNGSHMKHRQASRAPIRRADFELEKAADVLIDGEIIRCLLKSIEVLPGALEVVA